MNRALALVLAAAIWLGAAAAPAQERPEVIDWKHLVPAGYDPTDLVRRYQKEVSSLRDNDPRATKAAERLRQAWENAPVVQSLSNKLVKLSGFLVTLEGDGKAVSEFLLVPYFGACIHVPPPPSNQVVLIRTGKKPFKVNEMFDMVSVTGRLRTERAGNELASASYVIDATHIETHKP
jgi:hypothetical protein